MKVALSHRDRQFPRRLSFRAGELEQHLHSTIVRVGRHLEGFGHTCPVRVVHVVHELQLQEAVLTMRRAKRFDRLTGSAWSTANSPTSGRSRTNVARLSQSNPPPSGLRWENSNAMPPCVHDERPSRFTKVSSIEHNARGGSLSSRTSAA